MALKPTIMTMLWNAWGDPPPSDAECHSQLIFDYGFTESAATDMLQIYKENVEYAGLSEEVESEPPADESPETTEDLEDPSTETTDKAPPPSDPFFETLVGHSSRNRHQQSSPDQVEKTNDFKVAQDGDKLQVIGRNLDLEGVRKLRALLAKYEEILSLM